MITVTDLFCGAGGSGLGAAAVPGVELVMAANHWQLAIDTHATNFPGTDHDCADISQVDPRRYRGSDVLWASPECTNHSQARGVRRTLQHPDLFGNVAAAEAAERSRATMWDVPRFAEHHRYRVVVVENVVDAARWVLWPAWLAAMGCLGYRHRTVYLNSMHAPGIACPRAPQSRDRLYVVFWREGDPAPDVEPRPGAWCESCQAQVAAVQWFKRAVDRWGRYRAQYLYRCPRAGCHAVVEPYADPAAVAIEWGLPGVRIADRDRPLSDKTMARIRKGLARYARPPLDQPTVTPATRTGALLVPSGGTWNEDARPVELPMRTRTGRDSDALVVPVEGRHGTRVLPVSVPLRTQTACAESALVVPYYGTGVAHPASEPLRTVSTVDRFGVAFIAELRGGGSGAREVREPLATVTASGNHHMLVCHNTSTGQGREMSTAVEQRERVAQLGNAVTPPAAESLIRAVVSALGGAR
ncbi:MAG: DNA cytosine methyltransferase [Pseudonocardiaceae bacterium]